MKCIGIDLGTTNSLCSYWDENKAVLIPNSLGNYLTPSVVSVDKNGQIFVGQIAKERLISHPDNSASNFKRFMGTNKIFKLGKYSFSSEELSSLVIKSLKADAEAFFGEEVENVIISVPAYFNDAQRKATRNAAQLAGLTVERLISEPTAAAISYGLHQEEAETKFLVFDLGGGTFDVSVLELFEGVMEVKSIAGDNFLGGEDFTEVLFDYFIKKCELNISEIDMKESCLITKQAEICKCQLSNEQTGKISLSLKGKSYEVVVNRAEFENLVNHLVIKLRQPIERVLRDANIHPNEIDSIVLIGGATRMSIIRSIVIKMFNKFPYSNINPDEAVALGVAIQIALKERNEFLSEIILTDVCPYSLGTNVVKYLGKDKHEAGYFLPIIERNSPIPISRSEKLYTVSDNQTRIEIEIYQGESRRVENNLKIGELNVYVTPEAAGKQAIDVRYTYDVNGLLEVEVTTLATGEKNRIVIEKTKGSMTEKEIEEQLSKLNDLKIHPREKAENMLLIARGERLYEETVDEMREYISTILTEFECILQRQNKKEIKIAAEKLNNILDEIERGF